jgi:16S rRNA (cytosine1402-N4)-methyltransferase
MNKLMEKTKHVPVLLKEIITNFDLKQGDCFIDATLGGGGHFMALLEKLDGKGLAIGIDEDLNAILRVQEKLEASGFVLAESIENRRIFKKGGIKIILVNDNFKNLDKLQNLIKKNKVMAIFADLGLSTDQIEDTAAGFSYQNDSADLDMRLNQTSQVKASDLLNGLYKNELEKMFFELGDIAFSKSLVREIIKQRAEKPFQTVGQLKQIIQRIVPFHLRRGTNKHPEAKVFQALRIAVNQEFYNLQCFLPQAFETLASGGKLGVISFHSGEDRIVKDIFKRYEEEEAAKFINKDKYFTASEAEIIINKKSHSAKLRVIIKN